MDFGVKLKIDRILAVMLVFFVTVIEAQVVTNLSAPRPQPPALTFNACATTDLNGFSVLFDAPASLPGVTEYALQLSNKSGSFNSNTLILDRQSSAGGRVVTFNFNYPQNDGTGETLGSETYRLRVIVEGPTLITGNPSAIYYAYFYDTSIPIELEPRRLCTPAGELRATEGFEAYRWFRDDVRIPGESSRILNVTQPGTYHYIPEFGSCISPSGFTFQSNDAIVANDTRDVDIVIGASDTSICAENISVLTILSPEPNFTYQWIRDGEEIEGATSETFTATGLDAGGVYSLDVIDNTGGLVRCTTPSNQITITLLNPSITITSPPRIALIPGQNNVLTAEVTGGPPITITWFRDGVPIPNSNTTSLVALQPGVYSAQVMATSPCTINTVTASETVVVSEIDNLSITIDYDNPEYASCEFSRVGLQITEISSFNEGVITQIPPSDFSLLGIEWLVDGNSTTFTGQSILIEDAFLNGVYQARVGSGTVNFDSNTLPVQLNAGELQIETSKDNNLNLNESVTLFVELPDPSLSSLVSFQWFRNEAIAIEGETNQEFITAQAGNFSVDVTFDGCTTRLEAVNVSGVPEEIPNVITPTAFNNNRWILPPEYTGQPNVRVQILSQRGEEVFNQTNYNGDWPDGELNESIYYYIISQNENPVEQGSITIIR